MVTDHQGGHSRVSAESNQAGGDLSHTGTLHKDRDSLAGTGQSLRAGA